MRHIHVLFGIIFSIMTFSVFADQPEWVSLKNRNKDKPKKEVKENNSSIVSFNVEINGFEKKEKEEKSEIYDRISMPDCEKTTKEGWPELPVVYQLIAIPDCEDVDISISIIDEIDLGDYNIFPVPKKKHRKEGYGFIEEFYKVESAYALDEYYPNVSGEIVETGYIRDQKVALLALYPVLYNPKKKKVKVSYDLTIDVTFTGASSAVNKSLGMFTNAMHGAALNYEYSGMGAADFGQRTGNSLYKSMSGGGSVTWLTSKVSNIDADYLIITHSSLWDDDSGPLYDLAHHRKNINGYNVAIITIETILGIDPGDPISANSYVDIRNYVSDVYDYQGAMNTGDGHLGYVCLVGDAYFDNSNVMIPAFNYHFDGTRWVSNSDYYYACVAGEDDYPDLMLGRISAGTESELDVAVDKITAYEAISYTSWNRNEIALFDANWAPGNPELNPDGDNDHLFSGAKPYLESQNLSISYTVGDLNHVTESKTWLTNQFNQGRFVINYHGPHGGWDSWVPDGTSGEYFHSNDISNLNNNTHLPIIISTTCLTGGFYNKNERADCFAEKLLFTANKGAVSVIATTQTTNHTNVDLNLYKARYSNECHFLAEAFLVSYFKLSDINHKQFTLLGDPALNMWPTAQQVQEITWNTNQSLSENYYVHPGERLIIDGDSIALNGYQIKSLGGEIVIINNPTFSPNGGIIAKRGPVIKAVCSTLAQCTGYPFPIQLKQNYSVGQDTIKAYAKIDLNGYYIESQSSANIVRENNVTITPDIAVKDACGNYQGFYPDLTTALSHSNQNDEIVINSSILVDETVSISDRTVTVNQPVSIEGDGDLTFEDCDIYVDTNGALVVDNQGEMHIEEPCNIMLYSEFVKAENGTFTCDEAVSIEPKDVRVYDGTSLKKLKTGLGTCTGSETDGMIVHVSGDDDYIIGIDCIYPNDLTYDFNCKLILKNDTKLCIVGNYNPLNFNARTPIATFAENIEAYSGAEIEFRNNRDDSGDFTIKTAPGKEIYCNGGTIDAQGSSTKPLVFTSTTTNNWDGFRLYNAGSNSIFKYCDIKKADKGIYAISSSPDIRYCHIHDNTTGVYLYNGSDPSFLRNTIEDNTTGVHGYFYCEPDFALPYPDRGYNVIRDNSSKGIMLQYFSDAMLGTSNPSYYGYNSLYNNTYKDIYLYYSSDAAAAMCWWNSGYSPPGSSRFYVPSGCSVNYYPFLTANPGGGSPLAKGAEETITDVFDPETVDKNNPESLYELVKYYRYIEEDLDNALKTSKEIIKKFPDSEYARKALCQVYHISEKHKLSGMKTYFQSQRTKKLPVETQAVLFDLSVLKSIREGDYEEAEKLCLDLINDISDSGYEKVALYNLVLIYRHYLADPSKCQTYLNQLTDKYPNALLAEMANHEVGQMVALNKSDSEDSRTRPTEIKLNHAYPNPFNPVTMITYQLPEVAYVKLTVYNMMGQCVATLVNEEMPTGYHQVQWDAAQFGSGIYVYKLEVNGFVDIKKMMLVK